jgi:glycosyltransferase 2 family protein
MSHAAVEAVSPLRDDSRPRRFRKLAVWAVVIIGIAIVSQLLGWDLLSWFEDVWDEIKSISLASLVAGLFFQTLQTSLTAVAWLFILRAAYPDVKIDFRPILTCYALSVAMNGVLPANMGTFALLLMFVALIPRATFPGILTAYLVQKIFYTVIGAFVYLYLFVTVPDMPVRGSNSPDWDWFGDHLALTIILAGGAAFLLVLVLRIFWKWVKKMWEKAKVGGAILSTPRRYFTHVFAPSFGSWIAKLFVIGIFLGAYGIPVTFASIMHVVGSNSLASMVSVTPGGVGVNQAANVAALQDYTDATTATAYSLGQQLITTAWNIVFAIGLTVWVFGWTGGKSLVTESYSGAKEKVAEQKDQRAEKKAVKKAERHARRQARHQHDDDDT